MMTFILNEAMQDELNALKKRKIDDPDAPEITD